MSDLIGNPEDEFSYNTAQMEVCDFNEDEKLRHIMLYVNDFKTNLRKTCFLHNNKGVDQLYINTFVVYC